MLSALMPAKLRKVERKAKQNKETYLFFVGGQQIFYFSLFTFRFFNYLCRQITLKQKDYGQEREIRHYD